VRILTMTNIHQKTGKGESFAKRRRREQYLSFFPNGHQQVQSR